MSHLTESNRMKIELGLRNGMSFQELAKMLKKARSTILREVKKHRQVSLKGAPGRVHNRCVHRRNCDVYALCGDSKCNRKCSACRKCNSLCSKFKEETCLRLSKAPYVCNGCPDEHKCVLKKQHYICSTANKEYSTLLVEARKGANLSEQERLWISDTIHSGIKKGQSVHHIMSANKDSFNICEKSVYRYI